MHVVIAPTINYHFYPAFTEYPGATSLSFGTARDMVIDICKGLSKFGPTKFYILNTGVSTVRALQPASDSLQQAGITMHFTDLIKSIGPVEKKIQTTRTLLTHPRVYGAMLHWQPMRKGKLWSKRWWRLF